MTTISASPNESSRILMLDSLRGFTLLIILLLHSLLNFHWPAEIQDAQITFPFLDKYLWIIIYNATSGKVYTLFCFLFGFGFFLQFSSIKKKGEDFSWRFIWRMAILLIFGLINIGLFFGDILILYALTAPILVITRNWNNRNILILSVILLLSPFEWYVFLKYIFNTENGLSYDFIINNPKGDIAETSSFLEHHLFAFLNKIKFNLLWYFNEGRVFQAPGLFLLGVIAGRQKFLTRTNVSFYNKSIAITILLLMVLLFIKFYFSTIIKNTLAEELLSANLKHIFNLFFSALELVLFIRIWHTSLGERLLKPLAAYGKLSLSNYILQSFFGFIIFSSFCFSMSSISGVTISFIIALVILVVQLTLSTIYSKRYQYGPFEYIWRKITWINFHSKNSIKIQNSEKAI